MSGIEGDNDFSGLNKSLFSKDTVDHIFSAYTKFSRISRGHLQSRKYCARERSKYGKYFQQPVSAFAPGHLHLPVFQYMFIATCR